MKTQTLSFKAFFKKILMLSVLSLTLVACGENNVSGRSSNQSNSSAWGGFGAGPFIGGNGMAMGGDWMNVIAMENPCLMGGQRVQVQMPAQININAGALFVGVTSEGDIAVATNQGGVPTMTVFLCARPDLTGQGFITRQPITETSPVCPIGQITAADIALGGQYGQYYLKFAPIHIPGTPRMSSLCQQGGWW